MIGFHNIASRQKGLNACGTILKKSHFWLMTVTTSVVLLTGCMTYYEKTQVFNQHFEKGNYQDAVNYINKESKLQKNNVKIIYDLNVGTASFMCDDTPNSIKHFDAADKYSEDFSKNYAYEALTLVSNPTVKPYELEHHEKVMIHFYQALNYIKESNYEEAIVECRRMNLELQRISDSFRKNDGKHYTQDAFGHFLMGVLYETSGDNNNAFIAYRNAHNIYTSDYKTLFGQGTPDVVKQSLVRTAYATGFTAEGLKYEKEFGIKHSAKDPTKGRLVAFVLDGLSPIKSEKSLEFVKNNGVGMASFVSSDGSFTIPIVYANCSQNELNSLKDFSYIRLTLPSYSNRSNNDGIVSITVDGTASNIETVEDIEKIAHQSLKDRMWRELGKTILRAAVKETMHQVASKKNEYVGLLVNIANSVTEKADTRCWTTLPARVKIVEMDLSEGNHTMNIKTKGGQESRPVTISAGKTTFTIVDAL